MSSRNVQIVQLVAATLHALAAGELDEANRTAAVPLTPYFVSPEWAGTWLRRSTQVVDDPASAAWTTGVIWDADLELAVGWLAADRDNPWPPSNCGLSRPFVTQVLHKARL